MRTAALATCLAVALTVAACGDEEASTAPAGAGSSESSEQPESAAYGGEGAAADSRVEMRDSSFAPASVSVETGATVTFENASRIAHTATATEGAGFDSGSVGASARFEWKASEPGRVRYVCDFHPGMEGTIVVR